MDWSNIWGKQGPKGNIFQNISDKYREKFPEYFEESKENQYGTSKKVAPVEDFNDSPEEYDEDWNRYLQEQEESDKDKAAQREIEEEAYIDSMYEKVLSGEMGRDTVIGADWAYAKYLANRFGKRGGDRELFNLVWKARDAASRQNVNSLSAESEMVDKILESELIPEEERETYNLQMKEEEEEYLKSKERDTEGDDITVEIDED